MVFGVADENLAIHPDKTEPSIQLCVSVEFFIGYFLHRRLEDLPMQDIFPYFEEEKGPRDVARERIRERKLLSRIHSCFCIRILEVMPESAVWLLMYNGIGISGIRVSEEVVQCEMALSRGVLNRW
jgi:hypothetical protein